jgi:putative transposase
LIPIIAEWRNRPLEAAYPISFLDTIHFKVLEEGKVRSKAFYSILRVGIDGRKDILSMYISENEGAHFWLDVLNDIRARGVEDILIASTYDLEGFQKRSLLCFLKQKSSFAWYIKFATR